MLKKTYVFKHNLPFYNMASKHFEMQNSGGMIYTNSYRLTRVYVVYETCFYLKRCECQFSLMYINKTNTFCFLISNGRVLGMAKIDKMAI